MRKTFDVYKFPIYYSQHNYASIISQGQLIGKYDIVLYNQSVMMYSAYGCGATCMLGGEGEEEAMY